MQNFPQKVRSYQRKQAARARKLGCREAFERSSRRQLERRRNNSRFHTARVVPMTLVRRGFFSRIVASFFP